MKTDHKKKLFNSKLRILINVSILRRDIGVCFFLKRVLEDFNFAPRIAHKVRGADTETIRRNSLTKFHRYIEIENPNKTCFISGKLN